MIILRNETKSGKQKELTLIGTGPRTPEKQLRGWGGPRTTTNIHRPSMSRGFHPNLFLVLQLVLGESLLMVGTGLWCQQVAGTALL